MRKPIDSIAIMLAVAGVASAVTAGLLLWDAPPKVAVLPRTLPPDPPGLTPQQRINEAFDALRQHGRRQ